MSVLAELGTAARALADRIDAAVVSIGTDHRGSGVVIAPGKVVTNAHNLRDRSTLVTFSDGRAVQGTLSGSDVDGDLVVLDVDTASVPAVAPSSGTTSGTTAGATSGTSPAAEPAPSPVGLGDVVFAASRADDGLRLTVGFVSGVDRSFRGPRGRRIAGSIEHSAPLARGSSGGPLFSADGALVAINTHRVGRGFYLARPTDDALTARLADLQAGKTVAPRTLGVALAPAEVAARLRRAVGLAERTGLLVRQVAADSPAGRAGLAEGDLLVAASTGGSSRVLSTPDDLHAALGELGADETMELAVVRGSEELTVTVRFVTDEPSAT